MISLIFVGIALSKCARVDPINFIAQLNANIFWTMFPDQFSHMESGTLRKFLLRLIRHYCIS